MNHCDSQNLKTGAWCFFKYSSFKEFSSSFRKLKVSEARSKGQTTSSFMIQSFTPSNSAAFKGTWTPLNLNLNCKVAATLYSQFFTTVTSQNFIVLKTVAHITRRSTAVKVCGVEVLAGIGNACGVSWWRCVVTFCIDWIYFTLYSNVLHLQCNTRAFTQHSHAISIVLSTSTFATPSLVRKKPAL